uniref:Cadherin-like beta-sandwich-like domain-containing protein n=1 Tax=Caenorhabditis japonica TaxID=281687 RepID=A0A8R1IN44_CAEJA
MTQTNAANESDARLHGLYVSEVSSLSPEFNPDTYLYSAYVPSNQSFVNISAVPINENAKVTINGMEPLGELRHTKISLSYGTNTIHISTHIPNTNLTSSYVVVITRQQSGSDNLFDLSFSNLTLDRFFTSEVTNYYGTANPGVRQIGVTPITTNGSSVTINGKNVGSGSTQIVALNNETTIITVLIADSEGVSKTYTINVRRSDISTNASLKSVAVNQKEYTITNSNIMSYVDKGVSGAQLTLIPSDLSSTVKLNGNLIASNTVNVYLDSKQTNIFTITVTAADGITQKTYDLYVLRDLSHGSNVNQVSSTSLGSDTLIEIKNGELVVTEGKGASSTSQRGLNGSRNLIVTLNDTEIIKEINKASSTAKKMKIDYASLMGLDDRLTVKFSKNLLETLRLKESKLTYCLRTQLFRFWQ